MLLATSIPSLLLGIYWLPVANWIEKSLVFLFKLFNNQVSQIKIKKGHDVRMKGIPSDEISSNILPEKVSYPLNNLGVLSQN